MSNSDLLPAAVLRRKAVVYVRQSTQTQVQTNLESKRRQYDLVAEARRRGFAQVEVIDDDLGRSASGMVARPGFDRLVAWLCAGEVGAVLCFDASRLARNGRDWHHLLELCGLVEARVIDLDGVYDPCRPNDRLLLGMKGSISEFELGVLFDLNLAIGGVHPLFEVFTATKGVILEAGAGERRAGADLGVEAGFHHEEVVVSRVTVDVARLALDQVT